MISSSQGEFIIWINAITAYEHKYAHLSFLVLGFHLIFSYNTYIFHCTIKLYNIEMIL